MNNLPEGTAQLPPQFSTVAPQVDEMYMLIYWVSVVFTVIVTVAMVGFAWKYHRGRGHKPQPTGHSTALEILWTFTPLLLLGVLFHEGFTGFVFTQVAPDDAIDIRVRGMQWNWEFEHRNGVVDELNIMKVPYDTPVRLIMSSSDVLHSFYVPTMRVKRDVVPGMYSTLWFQATVRTDDLDNGNPQACERDADCPEGMWCGGRVGQEGRTCTIPVFCAEYCGAGQGITRSAFDDPDGEGRNTNHSTMMADMHVISVEAYNSFIATGPPPPEECVSGEDINFACWGEYLYGTSGCTACHSAEDGGPEQPAPNWTNIWGNERPLEGGATAQGDEEYIRESILQPQAQIVRGYAGVNMPPYRFSDNQLAAISAYIQSLAE